MKGAPEAVLDRCTLAAGGPDRAAVLADVDAIAAQGMRVLAVAVRRPSRPLGELAEADVEAGFSFLGLQGTIDPPPRRPSRPSAPPARPRSRSR